MSGFCPKSGAAASARNYHRQLEEKLEFMRRQGPTERSGFEDLPRDTRCKHDEHGPPTMLCVPEGQRYRHVCPACGAVSYLYPRGVSL